MATSTEGWRGSKRTFPGGKYLITFSIFTCKLTYTQTIGIPGPQVPVYHVLKSPQALLAAYNTTEHMLYTVSANHDSPCSIIGTFSPVRKCHLFVQNSLLGHLYYLGEYTGGVASKVTSDEYVHLPDEVS